MCFEQLVVESHRSKLFLAIIWDNRTKYKLITIIFIPIELALLARTERLNPLLVLQMCAEVPLSTLELHNLGQCARKLLSYELVLFDYCLELLFVCRCVPRLVEAVRRIKVLSTCLVHQLFPALEGEHC